MNRRVKRVCLITPNHIATNPRLVKEATALTAKGYAVHLVFTLSDEEGMAIDYDILRRHPEWTYDILHWGGKDLRSRWHRFSSGLFKRFSEKMFSLTGRPGFADFIVNRHCLWQTKKAIQARAELYIAHNLGALPVAKAAARKNKVEYGFDAEDFHRQEVSDDPASPDFLIKKTVEENHLPGVRYFTAASPLIGNAYRQIFPSLRPTDVLNVFPKVHLKNQFTGPFTSAVKLFWFSQTIGGNRGLETIVRAMGLTREENIELHLLGNPAEGYRQELEEIAEKAGVAGKVFFYAPVPEDEIFQMAMGFDIGMASEVGSPFNRDICLTNKIFTYIQCGLAVLASDTAAQAAFLEKYPNAGRTYRREDAESLHEQLCYYCMHRKELEQCKRINYDLGQTELNWEIEQDKFIQCIDNRDVRNLSPLYG